MDTKLQAFKFMAKVSVPYFSFLWAAFEPNWFCRYLHLLSCLSITCSCHIWSSAKVMWWKPFQEGLKSPRGQGWEEKKRGVGGRSDNIPVRA